MNTYKEELLLEIKDYNMLSYGVLKECLEVQKRAELRAHNFRVSCVAAVCGVGMFKLVVGIAGLAV